MRAVLARTESDLGRLAMVHIFHYPVVRIAFRAADVGVVVSHALKLLRLELLGRDSDCQGGEEGKFHGWIVRKSFDTSINTVGCHEFANGVFGNGEQTDR